MGETQPSIHCEPLRGLARDGCRGRRYACVLEPAVVDRCVTTFGEGGLRQVPLVDERRSTARTLPGVMASHNDCPCSICRESLCATSQSAGGQTWCSGATDIERYRMVRPDWAGGAGRAVPALFRRPHQTWATMRPRWLGQGPDGPGLCSTRSSGLGDQQEIRQCPTQPFGVTVGVPLQDRLQEEVHLGAGDCPYGLGALFR